MGIILKNITFKEDRALIKVQVEGCLTPKSRVKLCQLLCKKYPKIVNHACRNSKGPTFGDCVETTSIPHILEHIILEELSHDSTRKGAAVSLRNTFDKPEGQPPSLYSLDKGMKTFVAKTSNLGGGVAKIELKYYDDISTLQAIKRATSSLNELLSFAKCERFE